MSAPAPQHQALRLGADDDVVIALVDLAAGQRCTTSAGQTLTVTDDIPRGHKIAAGDLRAGDIVRKYGHVIGIATADVAPGAHVHSHNLGMPDDPTALATAGPAAHIAPALPTGLRTTFRGYRRADGRVGTRNYIAVLTSVNCSATVARQIVRRVEPELEGWGDDGVDGVFAATHGTGCGMASSGEGWEVLRRTLRGYAQNPNVAGVVVVGLGCEVNVLSGLVDDDDLPPGVPVARFTIQEIGGTRAAVDEGVRLVREMATSLRGSQRVEVGVEHLVLGMQCGGSDAFSGLTANPALGYASDLIVAQGGTSLLGETPEIYGAEQMLADRAATPQVRADLLDRIAWWERHTAQMGTSIDGNPSPGNKAGGITTILEKSLGSVAKGGHSPLARVLHYAERVDSAGLVFMDTPGYDPVSATGMVAGGATLVCFTTGRGSAFGSKPAPTVKLSTNRDLALRMADDIDLDCSGILEEGESIEAMGLRVYDQLLEVASGARSRSEELGLGDEEFVPWQLGAVL